MGRGDQKAPFGIIGSNTFSLKLAMHLASKGHIVRIVDDTIETVQAGLQSIAGWAEANRNEGILDHNQEGQLLQNIEIGCAVERLAGVQMVFFGNPIHPGRNPRHEEQFRLLEAVVPPETPILARLADLRSTGRLLDWVPNRSRVVPFATILDDTLPATWELWDAGDGRNEALVTCEHILHLSGFRSIRFQGGKTSPLRILFLRTLSNCCDMLMRGEEDVDAIDFAFPVSIINQGPFLTADLIGLERVLELNDDAGEVMTRGSLQLVASYLRTDRTGFSSGEGFYLYS